MPQTEFKQKQVERGTMLNVRFGTKMEKVLDLIQLISIIYPANDIVIIPLKCLA